MAVVLDPFALADETAFKLARRITVSTFDDAIRQCLNQATSIIETACDRQFKSRNYYEWIWDASRHIILAQRPVNRVVSIRYGNSQALNVRYTPDCMKATVEVGLDALVLRSVAADGTATETTLSFDTYKSASALVAAFSDASAVPSGWVATVPTGGNCESRQLKPIAASSVTGTGAILNAATTDIGVDHQLMSGAGLLAINYIMPTPNWLPLQVIYNAGYDDIPAALQKVCIDVAAGIYDRLARLAGLNGRTLGDYSESFSSMLPVAVAELGGLTPEQFGLLGRWAEVSVGKTQ